MSFTHEIATPGGLPLAIALAGETGCGKTRSALELAQGIQQVRGGDVWLADTDNRAREYAKLYQWNRIPFAAPYSPQRFQEATKYAFDNGARIFIIDSMSDEHDGPGGLLEMHEAFVRQACGKAEPTEGDRGRYGQQGWARVKPARKRFENYVRSLRDDHDVVFIFTYRAAIKYQPKTRDEKLRDDTREPTDSEWSISSTSELPYLCSVRFLMVGGSCGQPITKPITSTERRLFKLTDAFAPYVATVTQLNAEVGRRLYEIAKGPELGRARAVSAPEELRFNRSFPEGGGGTVRAAPAGLRARYAEWLNMKRRDAPDTARRDAISAASQALYTLRVELGEVEPVDHDEAVREYTVDDLPEPPPDAFEAAQ